jgi:hypothetical protein
MFWIRIQPRTCCFVPVSRALDGTIVASTHCLVFTRRRSMAYRIAIALFRALGTAQDARNRLVQQGVADQHVELRRLSKDTVVPPEEAPQTMISFVDWVFGNDLSARYGTYVRNGETVLCVRVRDDDKLAAAVETIRHYEPLRIDRVTAPERAPG